MNDLSTALAARGPVLVPILVLLSIVFLTSKLFSGKDASDDIPLVGGEHGNAEKRRKVFISQAKDLYLKGYNRFKDKVFRLTTTDGDQYIVPRSALDELRRMSDDHVNIEKALEATNEVKYTKLGGNQAHTNLIIHLVKGPLTHGLTNCPPCEDWTPVVVYERVLRIVAIISGNIFIGPDHCRNDEYLHHSINYTVDLFQSVGKLKQWKWWRRPIGQYFIKELKTVDEHRRKAKAFLAPIVAQRRKAMNAGENMPDDMLQWMLEKAPEFGVPDEDLSIIQLNMSLAAIHTTTLTTTLALYDLVVRPGLIEDLREEVKTVLADNEGIMTTHALFQMKLLDSFMKESQQTNPGNLVRFNRYTKKPLTLNDGTRLPAGKIISVPHALIVKDPELYTNPDTFDARRFLDLRTSAAPDPLNYKNKEQYQFVTVTKDFMAFGYGRHACPGRFFAANEIKLILGRLLLEYDMRMPDGLTEQYANIDMGTDAFPDPTKEIMFRKLSV